MASTKEGLVVIFDLSKNTREQSETDSKTFFEKEKECCTKLLQSKIFANKKDEISILLMGSTNTDNELNRTLDGYLNLVEALPMQIPNWNMLVSFINPLDKEIGSNNSDWLDALILALNVLKTEEVKRFKILKIVLFHKFLTDVDESSVEVVIKSLQAMDVELIIVNDNVKYIDDEAMQPTGIFTDNRNKTELQKKSENLVEKLLSETTGSLCNFDIALTQIQQGIRPKSRPWFWNSQLEIGSKITINVAVTISIKEENNLKWSTETAYPEAQCWKTTEYFKNGDKTEPEPDALIKGYMLGTTPIPYDKSLGITETPTKKGMKCIGFALESSILPQYFLGTGTYLLFPKAGMEKSEKIMVALVEALVNLKMVMIATRVYNDGNRAKFVVLIPNMELKFPCLTLYEIICAEQQVFWKFPSLKTKKTEPNREQLDAIEALMDSMNLDEENASDEPRNGYYKDKLPLKSLPNVTYDYICQLATERVLQNSEDIIASLSGRDEAFKVPDDLISKSKEPLEKIKELFPLVQVKKEGKKELIRAIGDINAQDNVDNELLSGEEPLGYKVLNAVGTVTPAEDYKVLIKREVEDLDPEKEDLKMPIFERISRQMQEVLSDLIFKTITPQNEKVEKALKAYRDEACFYNPYDYNDWIKDTKTTVVNRKMFDFWENIIVKNEFGLLCAKDCDFFDDMDDKEPEEFYKINTGIAGTSDDNNADANVDDLFDDM